MKGINEQAVKVLAFAREAGGAEAVAPVCRAMLTKGWQVLLLSKGHGADVFKRRNLAFNNFQVFSANILERLVYERFSSMPDIVLTSATSLPELDMTERYLWKWGSKHGIPTFGLLDQWQNYTTRFSGPGEKERLVYMPERILVMDELARTEMIAEGLPEDKIIVTGQPAFDEIAEDFKGFLKHRDAIRVRLNIPDNHTIVTFICESLKKDYGAELGYDEQSVLMFLGEILNGYCLNRKNPDICLIIKLHPENTVKEFQWVMSMWPDLEKRIIQKDTAPIEVLAVSEIVIGMTSTLLTHGIIVKRAVVSLQLDSKKGSQFAATKLGAIPFIRTRAEGEDIISRLLGDKTYKKSYLERQSRWNITTKGTDNCMEFLNHYIRNHREVYN